MLKNLSRVSFQSLSPVWTRAFSRQKSSSPRFLSQDQVQKFHKDGFLTLDGFYSAGQCQGLRAEIENIIATFKEDEHRAVFSTTKQTSDDYFLQSNDRIRFFFEEKSFGEDGKLLRPLRTSINKVGHGLHLLSKPFRDFTHDTRNKLIAHDLGIVKPVIPQSMYIFKQPGIGGVVVPHQDSTFLFTSPLSTLGFWVPQERCTTNNGCLWVSPGSHLLPITARWKRTATGMQFDSDVKYPPLPESSYQAVEINAGTLVLLHGSLVHRSEENKSSVSRQAYTWHVVDGTATYDALNWLQPSKEFPFPEL